MFDAYIGEIFLVTYSFAPQGFADCNGQLLSIAQNAALFSLLGTTFGGNGSTTFALPDLRGKVPVGMGQGPGLSSYTLGQIGGAASVALILPQLPIHNHSLSCSSASGTSVAPANGFWASSVNDTPYATTGSTVPMSTAAVGNTGSGAAHENQQPYLCLRYVIAITGIYPSRS